MSKHLVLSVKPYNFENKQGERIRGARVAYINGKPSVRENEFGHPPMLVSVSEMNLVGQLAEVPGVYDLEFEQVTGKNNKPEIILTGASFIKSVNISELF
jgi:hypothetical protein